MRKADTDFGDRPTKTLETDPRAMDTREACRQVPA